MHKIYATAVLLLALNAITATVQANAVIDSIGVENSNGKKTIIHQTTAKETYYSIGRKYNVAPKDIMSFNDNKFLQIGVIIKVPTNIPFSSSAQVTKTNTTETVEYVVKPKDNLNAIAEKLGVSVADIKTLNNLTGSNLSIGQILKIPAKSTAVVAAPIPAEKIVAAVVKTVEVPSGTLIDYTVKPREYLNKIAENFGTTADEIKKVNNLSSNSLHIGQILKIPATKNIEDAPSTQQVVEKPSVVERAKESTGKHIVKAGETIFSIAQQYAITAYQIRKANNLEDNVVSAGQTLNIPSNIVIDVPVVKEKVVVEKVVVEKPVVEKKVAEAKPVKEEVATPQTDSFIHTVIKGESIFSIAQKYSLTAYQIRVANNLTDNAIAIGQKLAIPKPPEPKSVNEVSKANQEETADSTTVKDPKLRRDPSVYGLSQIEEKGTAVWISDVDLDSSKMLVLHRTAPIGRVIKITNPMTNRTTFAKVVGKFTENESTKDVIIVMTKAVADSLGALDKRFFCNLIYSAQ